MLSLEFIKNHPQIVEENLQRRGVKVNLDQVLALDQKRRGLISVTEKLQSERNQGSKENLDSQERTKGKELKKTIKENLNRLKEIEENLNKILLNLPNLLQKEVPDGKEGTVLRTIGEKTKFDFVNKSYLDLNENLDLIDIPRAVKVAGPRFTYLKREAVLLEFALIHFALDTVLSKNFIPILPPMMIQPSIMESLGYGGLAKQDTYCIEKDNLNLIGTSEHSMGAMYQNEILEEKSLPQRFIGFSTCFRREAGSYGKDIKGIIREHQFDKLEMFSFCHPDRSSEEHGLLVDIEEELMQKLKLPYRVVRLGSQDLSASSSMTLDIETWFPSEDKYRETHSCSNCTDYQARGLGIRYRSPGQKPDFVHTLNGTAFAIGRMLIAILENYQQKDGSVKVPTILQPYLNFKEIRR